MRTTRLYLATLLIGTLALAETPKVEDTSITELIRSVPSAERGPDGKKWTDEQIDIFKKALRERLRDHRFRLRAGRVKDVGGKHGEIKVISVLPKFEAAGLHSEVRFTFHLSDAGAKVAGELDKKEDALGTGTFDQITIQMGKYNKGNGGQRCDMDILFKDAIVE